MDIKEILKKTFGGLTKTYLIRQYLFGLLIMGFVLIGPILAYSGNRKDELLLVISMVVLMWFFYPYSRFTYERVVDFIMGNNTFLIDSYIFLVVKVMTMGLCFVFSPIIAPLGLIYLYFYHTKKEKESLTSEVEG